MPSDDLRLLHEDPWLVAVDKPSGLPVHRGWARDRVVLTDLLEERLGRGAVHPLGRLDRGTSGESHCSSSPSLAASGGAIATATILLRPLGYEGHVDHRTSNMVQGPRSPFRTVSLVAAFPRTGRLHQIRRHLRHIGHPVIGDSNYGRPDLNRALKAAYGLSRLALHCASVRLRHPFTHELLQLVAPLPDDLVEPLVNMGFETADWSVAWDVVGSFSEESQ